MPSNSGAEARGSEPDESASSQAKKCKLAAEIVRVVSESFHNVPRHLRAPLHPNLLSFARPRMQIREAEAVAAQKDGQLAVALSAAGEKLSRDLSCDDSDGLNELSRGSRLAMEALAENSRLLVRAREALTTTAFDTTRPTTVRATHWLHAKRELFDLVQAGANEALSLKAPRKPNAIYEAADEWIRRVMIELDHDVDSLLYRVSSASGRRTKIDPDQYNQQLVAILTPVIERVNAKSGQYHAALRDLGGACMLRREADQQRSIASSYRSVVERLETAWRRALPPERVADMGPLFEHAGEDAEIAPLADEIITSAIAHNEPQRADVGAPALSREI